MNEKEQKYFFKQSDILARGTNFETAIPFNNGNGVGLIIAGYKRQINLVLASGEAVEIIYDLENPPEDAQKELETHILLERISGKIRDQQFTITNNAIQIQSGLERHLDLLPNSARNIAIFIIKFILSIILLIQLKPPFLRKELEQNQTEELLTLNIFYRCIKEIKRQKEHYEREKAKFPDPEEHQKLIDAMNNIIYNLEKFAESKTIGVNNEPTKLLFNL